MSDEQNLKGKISEFLNGIGRSIKKKITTVVKDVKRRIENVGTLISIKYLNLATAYFNKKAKHLQNLKDRKEFDKPMLRDFPKYVGLGIYNGFACLFASVAGVLDDWRVDREFADDKKAGIYT